MTELKLIFSKEIAINMGRMAQIIAESYKLDGAVILLVKDNAVGCYVGDWENEKFEPAKMIQLFRSSGKYFSELAVKLEKGEIKPIDLEDVGKMFPNSMDISTDSDQPPAAPDPKIDGDWSTAL